MFLFTHACMQQTFPKLLLSITMLGTVDENLKKILSLLQGVLCKRKMSKEMHNWRKCDKHCDRRVCTFLLREFIQDIPKPVSWVQELSDTEIEIFSLVYIVHSRAICAYWLSFGNFML